MRDDLTEMEGYDKWIEHAEGSMFFGKSLSEMSKKELLGIVGWMCEDHKRDLANKEKDHKFLMDIQKSCPRPVYPWLYRLADIFTGKTEKDRERELRKGR